MSKSLLVAQREYLDNVRTKSFWIGIFIFPVILVIAVLAPILLEKTKKARTYVVIDKSGWVLEQVDQNLLKNELTIVINEVVKLGRLQKDNLTDIPEVFHKVLPQLVELEDPLLPIVAEYIVSRETDKLPDAVKASLQFQRKAILKWWSQVSPGDAANISKRLARVKFLRKDLSQNQKTPEVLNQMIEDEKLFAYFMIGEQPLDGIEGSSYVSKNLTDSDLRVWFEGLVTNVVRSRRLEQKQIEPEVARWLMKYHNFNIHKIGAAGTIEKVKKSDKLRQWLPAVFVYILWFSVFAINQTLLTNTVEEKSSRIIEVLLSSISPIELMAGKIIGIGATGLTLVGTWMVAFFFVVKFLPGLVGIPASLNLSGVVGDPLYLISFVVYFLLGFLFYAGFLVSIGSVCNTIKEAQNMMGPVTIMLMIPIFIMVPIAKDPNGTLAKVLSYIPPFTPFVMMNRSAGSLTLFEYLSTTILMVIAIIAVLWIAAKVFRIGILMTGKPPSIPEIVKWLKVPVGILPVRKDD